MIGLAEARRFEAAASAMLDALEPDAVPSSDAVPVWEAFDAAARKVNAMVTLMARRVEESRAWVRAGDRSAAEFMAKRSGTSAAAARTQLDTARKVDQLPAVEQRLRTGALSGPQAALVVEGASVNPDATERLLEQAERGSLKDLRDEVLRLRAAADPDPGATERRIHAERRVRTWRDGEGAWNLAARGSVADGARIESALNALIEEVFAQARAHERREPREAYAFDALVGLARRTPTAGDVKMPTLRIMTIVRVELDALQRGTVEEGEICDIRGIGPVSATTARELLGESILKLVITKGTDVLNVTHLGRGPTTAQQVALWSSPVCIVEGCNRTRVEVDHGEPWAKKAQTRLDNLRQVCDHHHDLKTRHGWELVEGTGQRPMVPPHDPRHPGNRPEEDTS